MIQFFRALDKSALAVFIFGLSFFALLYSKWLLSLSLFLLIPLALINVLQNKQPGESFGKAATKYFAVYRKYPPYWGLGLIFLTVLLSGLLLGTSGYWEGRIRIKLPLLIAPILFAFIAPLNSKYYRRWVYLLVALGLASLIGVLINYGLDYSAIHDSISKGGSIPTPISHIRYTIFLAFVMTLGFWMYLEKDFFKPGIAKLGLVSGIVIFIGLHILSVRSGLLTAYLSLLLCIGYWVIKEKKWLLGAGVILLVFFAPWLGYKNIPSLRSKIDYTLHDFSMYQRGEGTHYSDGERIYSIQVGWQLFQSHPLVGVGVGNFKTAIADIYGKNQPESVPKMPHNQFISILASTGILGLVISLVGILLPLFYRKNYRHLPLLAFYLILLVSMLVENTLETSVGLSLFLLPVLIMNNFLIGQRSN